MQCSFVEPWIGQCKEPCAPGSIYCEKHSKEKCQVCGEQATTRCQASIGCMCGVPLCGQCGAGQMCLDHATEGPVAVIAMLLGRGPRPTVFSTRETLHATAIKMQETTERLKQRQWDLSMEDFWQVYNSST